MKRRILIAALLIFGCSAWAGRKPYGPYQSIVDRQMFGPLPADFDPSKLPSEAKSSSKHGKQAEALAKEQEKLKSAVRFSVINVTPDGTVKVGFTDRSDSKNPRNYYLGVGESRDGWVVKEADPDTATMTIEKGEIEITLTIGGDSSKRDGATKKSGAATASSASPAPDVSKPRSGLLLNNRLNKNRMSKREMAERLEAVEQDRAKERAERAAEREREKAEAEARRKQEQEDLKNELRQMVLDSKASREETKPVRELSEEANNENNDAE